jgi:hypothetical protein
MERYRVGFTPQRHSTITRAWASVQNALYTHLQLDRKNKGVKMQEFKVFVVGFLTFIIASGIFQLVECPNLPRYFVCFILALIAMYVYRGMRAKRS